jgi:flagellar P-ring protein precursor FlgI
MAVLMAAVFGGIVTLTTTLACGQDDEESPLRPLHSSASEPQFEGLTIGDICTLKGQEGNTLSGLGIVVGLNGTGDGKFDATATAILRYMQKMRVPISGGAGAAGGSTTGGFDAKNCALVSVMAEVDGQGGRQGSQIDCVVSAIYAKSLKGGTLLVTPLVPPVPPTDDGPEPMVFAMAQGALRFDDPSNATNGRITRGCRLERNINNVFVKDNKITLVIRAPHARFSVAEQIAFALNESKGLKAPEGMEIAHAVDQVTVEVQILQQYRANPVSFASLVLQQGLERLRNVASVWINETTGVIVISGDLKISREAIQHKNMVVNLGDPNAVSQFMEFDMEADSSVPTLTALVQSLNALRVSNADMIQIIRTLDEKGSIQGQVVYR